MKASPPKLGQEIGKISGPLVTMGFWLWQYLVQVGRNPTTTVAPQAVGASPYLYTNAGDFDIDAIVTAGTVSAVAFTRDGTNFYTVATATNATVRLNPGDSVRVTYTVLPTLTLIPR